MVSRGAPPSSGPRVLLIRVDSVDKKCRALLDRAYHYFNQGRPLLFRLDTQKGLDFLDRLLWSHPADSFLPHLIASADGGQVRKGGLLALTQDESNPYGATAVFNLAAEPVPHKLGMEQIYTFDDRTDPKKRCLGTTHYRFYKELGYQIVLSD